MRCGSHTSALVVVDDAQGQAKAQVKSLKRVSVGGDVEGTKNEKAILLKNKKNQEDINTSQINFYVLCQQE